MQSEVTITIKGEDTSFKKKFLCYESFSIEEKDPILWEMITTAREEFKGQPDEISIKVVAYL